MSDLQLRPYQTASVEKLRDGFKQNHTRQVLSASTGAGKSIIMMNILSAAQAKGKRVMFICERRVLVEQFSKHLDNARIDHGVLMSGHWRFRPDRLVQIASAQTLERMTSIPQTDLIFIDEVHACLRASIVNLFKAQPNLKVIGATATPFHPLIAKYFSNVVSVTTMADLVKENYLVPFRVFVAHEIDTKGLKIVAGEFKKDDLEARGKLIVGDVVADYVRISNDVFGGYRKTICFSCGIQHGAELAQRFNEAGINAIQISSNDDDEYRDQVLRDFAKPDSDIKIVISVAILSRGFDQSDIEHVILARPLKKSFSEHVQMMGRGARMHPGKQMCIVQDNSGNFLRFQEQWDDLYHNGVTELLEAGPDSKPKKEPSESEKEAAKCPKCSALWVGKTDICAHCGFVRAKANAVQALAGKMQEISSSSKSKKAPEFTQEYKRNFYAQLLGYAFERGHHHGSAFHKYKAKFGVGPAGAKPEKMFCGTEVRNFITSTNIRNAHGRGR